MEMLLSRYFSSPSGECDKDSQVLSRVPSLIIRVVEDGAGGGGCAGISTRVWS